MGGAVIIIESEEQWAAELDKAKAAGKAVRPARDGVVVAGAGGARARRAGQGWW